MLALLWAALSMAAKDLLATLLTIAESRGRALLAASFDASNDIAALFVTVYGAGEVVLHGYTLHTISLIAVIAVTSFVGTYYWTRLGKRLMPDGTEGLTLEIAALKTTLAEQGRQLEDLRALLSSDRAPEN
jgi:hypothetical protein